MMFIKQRQVQNYIERDLCLDSYSIIHCRLPKLSVCEWHQVIVLYLCTMGASYHMLPVKMWSHTPSLNHPLPLYIWIWDSDRMEKTRVGGSPSQSLNISSSSLCKLTMVGVTWWGKIRWHGDMHIWNLFYCLSISIYGLVIVMKWSIHDLNNGAHNCLFNSAEPQKNCLHG